MMWMEPAPEQHSGLHPSVVEESAMHQMVAAFFALLFSFGHAAPAPRCDALEATPVYNAEFQSPPTRQELAHLTLASRYAGSACLSCRRTRTATTAFSRER